LVAVRMLNPRPGEPCEDVHYEHVAFVVSGDAMTAQFSVFGGLSTGTLRLTPDQSRLADSQDAYVADVQLGTYEQQLPRIGLACLLDPTYHFDCPSLHTLDHLCLVWTPKLYRTHSSATWLVAVTLSGRDQRRDDLLDERCDGRGGPDRPRRAGRP